MAVNYLSGPEKIKTVCLTRQLARSEKPPGQLPTRYSESSSSQCPDLSALGSQIGLEPADQFTENINNKSLL
jgi:hypothetical protein